MKLSVSQGGARTEISKASVQRVGLRHPADLAAGTLDGVEVVDGGLRLGSGHELIENGDFSAGMAGWRLRAPDRGTARVVGGELEIVDDGSNPNGPSVVPDYSLSLSVGAWYRAACDYRVVSGYGQLIITLGGPASALAGAGSHAEMWQASDPAQAPAFYSRDSSTVYYDNISVRQLHTTGTRTAALNLSSAGRYADSTLTWQADAPAGTAITVEISHDDGATWLACTNGQPLPGLTAGQALGTALLRQTLTTDDPTVSPVLHSLSVLVNSEPRIALSKISVVQGGVRRIVWPAGFGFELTLTENLFNFVLTDWLLAQGWDGVSRVAGVITIPEELYISCDIRVPVGSIGEPAFDTGVYPADSDVTLVIPGLLAGVAGVGGLGNGSQADPGTPGGTALVARSPLKLDLTGLLAGGGGGGGGYSDFEFDSGGFGAGYYDPRFGSPAMRMTPGRGDQKAGDGGAFGEPGEPGEPGGKAFGDGGPAGYAIRGEDNITWLAGNDAAHVKGPRSPTP